ncbi:MAG: phosphotransferase family protein [Clostridia bacterium]
MTYVKRRAPPIPGSISAALGSFTAEVRFYREIAPVINVRVPHCYEAAEGPSGTFLVLEDLTDWVPGGKPPAVAEALRLLHDNWEGRAEQRWPWLRPVGAAIDLVAALYDGTWPRIAELPEMSDRVRACGHRLCGRVPDTERQLARIPSRTLIHGDASLNNIRSAETGEVAFVDWEDVSCAPGVSDLAWLLVSSVSPEDWRDTCDAYGPAPHLVDAMPAALVQGFLSLADFAGDAASRIGWIRRIEAGVGVVRDC